LHAVAARVRRELATRYAPERLIGVSPALVRVRKQIELAASSPAANVAIVGPAGVGKRHAARTIHALRLAATPASDLPPLVPLDGPTLNAELLQSAIRGLARASRDPARRGDLVIHDVDRMPADAQLELAGFLRLVDLPTRLIVTAGETLTAAAERGAFRQDLAAWLTTLVIELPALARRAEDVPPLAQFFLEETNAAGGRQLGGFTSDALSRLVGYAWPGNVAELAEVVAESCAKADGPLVAVADLSKKLHWAADAARYPPRAEKPIVLDDYLAEVEKNLLRETMARARGNKTKAAALLGVTRPRLYRRLVQLGLEEGPIVFEQTGDEESPG
jgi:DNA-binding NtrC family response regulator